MQYLHVTQDQETITISTSWSCPSSSFPDNRRLCRHPAWLTSCSSPYWPESVKAVSVEDRLVSLHFFEQLPSWCCCLKLRTSHLMMRKIRCIPQMWSQYFFFWTCAEGQMEWLFAEQKKLLEWNRHHQPDTPLSGQISLQHKARKAFPCAICFSEKQAMSDIYISSTPYFILDKTLFWKNKFKKSVYKFTLCSAAYA